MGGCNYYIMEKTRRLLAKGFESSSGLTPEFAGYARTFKREVSSELERAGLKLESFNRGHFYVSGFFSKEGKYWYFSQSDVRGLGSDAKILLRTAQNLKDYTGGINNYASLQVGMFDHLPKH